MNATYVLNLDREYLPYHSMVDLGFEKFIFPGGEVHIKLGYQIEIAGAEIKQVTITHRLNSSNAIFEVLLAVDALRRKYGEDLILYGHFPYIPYGRQDRVMVEGEPLSLKVMADILNSCKFRAVYTLDPHSDVTAALVKNLKKIYPQYLLSAHFDLQKYGSTDRNGEYYLMVPDGGALKKSHDIAKFIHYKGTILCANKVRDVETGKIIRTETPKLNYAGKTILIVDDILDGGRTFIELAKVLKAVGAKRVFLAVSHAIVSRGEEELAKWIDKIYTTDSIKNGDDESKLIQRCKIHE